MKIFKKIQLNPLILKFQLAQAVYNVSSVLVSSIQMINTPGY